MEKNEKLYVFIDFGECKTKVGTYNDIVKYAKECAAENDITIEDLEYQIYEIVSLKTLWFKTKEIPAKIEILGLE